MKTNRPFTPRVINELDEYLLLQHPETWSARTHMVAYFSIIFYFFLIIVCFISPDDPRENTEVYLWVTLLGIVSLILLIIWLIYLLRFNVFKRFGNQGPFSGLKTFFLYLVAVFLIVLVPFVPPYVESIRANNKYGNDEVVRDINSINTKILQLERDSIPLRWSRDTFQVFDKLEGRKLVYDSDANPRTVSAYLAIDTAEFRSKMSFADSLHKVNDSVYVFYESPDYLFVNSFYGDVYSKEKILSSVQLSRMVVQPNKSFDRIKVSDELTGLIKKYNPYDGMEMTSSIDYDASDSYKTRISNKFDLTWVNNSFSNITERKYRWEDPELALHFLYYVTLGLTLLVFIFRHSTVKTFFLTLLTVVILLILSTLFGAFADLDGSGMFILCLFYYAMFFVLAAVGTRERRRKAYGGIALNLTVFFTPLLFLVMVGLYYERLRERYRLTDAPAGLYDNEGLHFLYAEIAGFVVLIILITFLFRKMYRSWYALPDQ